MSLWENTHFENYKQCSLKSKNQKEATLNATGNDNTFLHFCFYYKKQHVMGLSHFSEEKIKTGTISFCWKTDCFFVNGLLYNNFNSAFYFLLNFTFFLTNKQAALLHRSRFVVLYNIKYRQKQPMIGSVLSRDTCSI